MTPGGRRNEALSPLLLAPSFKKTVAGRGRGKPTPVKTHGKFRKTQVFPS